MGGKAGLVTGAASGIGRAIAATLVESGAEVLLVDRDGPALEATARELVAEAYAVDLAADSAPESAVGRTVVEWGRIDFLVNAAGVQARGPAIELSDEDWEMLHAVNLRAVFRACRAAYDGRRRHPERSFHLLKRGGARHRGLRGDERRGRPAH